MVNDKNYQYDMKRWKRWTINIIRYGSQESYMPVDLRFSYFTIGIIHTVIFRSKDLIFSSIFTSKKYKKKKKKSERRFWGPKMRGKETLKTIACC